MKYQSDVALVGALLLSTMLSMPAAAAPRPPAGNSQLGLTQKTLRNGLQVLVVENHAQPLVTVEIAVRNGSMTEPPE